MSTFELAVAYRICPRFGRDAYNPFSWTKLRFSEICLRSLVESLSDTDFRFDAILDGCPPEYRAMIEATVPGQRLVCTETAGIGNTATFFEQIRVLLEQESAENVYFAEDDYLYLPDALPRMLAMQAIEPDAFVTPYDHPDYYVRRLQADKQEFIVGLHGKPVPMAWEAGCHWRQASSTTCTFMTRRDSLRRVRKWLRLYPVIGDYGMWLAVTRMRRVHAGWRNTLRLYRAAGLRLLLGRAMPLWVPVPALASHLVAGCLSPGRDWHSLLAGMSRDADGAGPPSGVASGTAAEGTNA